MRLEKSIYTHSSSSSVKDLLLFSKKGESKGIFCFGPNVLLMVIPCHNDRFHLEHKSPSKQRIPSWRINATREGQNSKPPRHQESKGQPRRNSKCVTFFRSCQIYCGKILLFYLFSLKIPLADARISRVCLGTIIFKKPDFDLLILPFKLQLLLKTE